MLHEACAAKQMLCNAQGEQHSLAAPQAPPTHPGIIDSAYTSCVAVPATRDAVNSVLRKYENEMSAALKSQ
jgi:hypothetical protein